MNDSLELDGVPGLEDVAEDVPFVDRVDHRLDVGVAGEEHADGVGLKPPRLAEERISGHPRHPLIGEDQLDLMFIQQGDRLSARAGREHPVRTVELVPQAFQYVHLIIDDQ